MRPEVAGACEILGIDPLYVANEGRLVAIVAAEAAEAALAAPRARIPLGAGAADRRRDPRRARRARPARHGFGGSRIVDMLVGDPLPRIC